LISRICKENRIREKTKIMFLPFYEYTENTHENKMAFSQQPNIKSYQLIMEN